MHVDEDHAAFTAEVDGKTYYFCSESCMLTFVQPEEERAELKRMVAFSLGLGLLTMALMFYRGPLPWISKGMWAFLLATPVQFIAGWRYYRGAWGAAMARTMNMDTLIVVGTSTAWVYSTIVVFFPNIAPSHEVYFDTAALIIALILVGKLLEEIARGRASEAVRRLLDLGSSAPNCPAPPGGRHRGGGARRGGDALRRGHHQARGEGPIGRRDTGGDLLCG
jgi:Cu+-exporting ATPase